MVALPVSTHRGKGFASMPVADGAQTSCDIAQRFIPTDLLEFIIRLYPKWMTKAVAMLLIVAKAPPLSDRAMP